MYKLTKQHDCCVTTLRFNSFEDAQKAMQNDFLLELDSIFRNDCWSALVHGNSWHSTLDHNTRIDKSSATLSDSTKCYIVWNITQIENE